MTDSGWPALDPALSDVAAGGPGTGAGAAAASTAAMAAALVEVVARASIDGWEEARGTIAQAQALRSRASELAEQNALAYADVRAALQTARDGGAAELGEALNRAADLPSA